MEEAPVTKSHVGILQKCHDDNVLYNSEIYIFLKEFARYIDKYVYQYVSWYLCGIEDGGQYYLLYNNLKYMCRHTCRGAIGMFRRSL